MDEILQFKCTSTILRKSWLLNGKIEYLLITFCDVKFINSPIYFVRNNILALKIHLNHWCFDLDLLCYIHVLFFSLSLSNSGNLWKRETAAILFCNTRYFGHLPLFCAWHLYFAKSQSLCSYAEWKKKSSNLKFLAYLYFFNSRILCMHKNRFGKKWKKK